MASPDSDPDRAPVTRLLQRMVAGEVGAADQLLPLVYDQLKGMARRQMARLRPGETLQPTALVHEAWLQVAGPAASAWDCRAHFFGAAARAMRNVLVGHARQRSRQKRGGAMQRRELGNTICAPDTADPVDVLALDEALTRFESEHERPARVLMLRYFAGLTNAEVATVLGVVERTVERDWLFATTWLRRALGA